MASIPGARFDITGASGSQGLLSPRSSWRAYVLPRGGHASQDSTGTLITFDSSAVASRFAANNWIQRALATADIRQVLAVGGNSVSISGAALTVSENDRIYLIGNTQPSVTGGSATYLIPQTIIRQRDDDAADIYTNSMVTSNSDGLIQFFGAPNYYDVIVQDGNQANQGSIIDLPLGAVDGISTSVDALFGASLTINGALGVTGWATFGSTVTMNAAMGVTGWATFGSTVTMNSTLGVTGIAAFGSTITIVGTSGNYSHAGTVTFGQTVTISGISASGQTVTVLGVLSGNTLSLSQSFGASLQPQLRLTTTSGLSFTSAISRDVTWNTVQYNVGGLFTPSANSSTITIPTGQAGLYMFVASLEYSANGTGNRDVRVQKNGSPLAANSSRHRTLAQGSTDGTMVMVSAMFQMAVGDTASVVGLQTSGTTLSLVGGAPATSRFDVTKLS